VGQNLLSSWLTTQVGDIPGVDPTKIVNEGAGELINQVSPELQPEVKEVYNAAISRVFMCAMGVALAAVMAALFMEWKNIKKSGPPGSQGEQSNNGSKEVVVSSTERSVMTSRPVSPPEVHETKPLEPQRAEANPSQTDGVTQDMENGSHGSPPEAEKSGCQHCEHCRLSRAVTLAPSEPPSRFSRVSHADSSSLPSNLPSSSQTERISGLEEAARLASIARNAIAQIEELTRPFSALGSTAGTNEQFRTVAQHQSPFEREGCSNPNSSTGMRGSFTAMPSTPAPPNVEGRDSMDSLRISNFPSPSQIPVEEHSPIIGG
jgi:hypothetical protein